MFIQIFRGLHLMNHLVEVRYFMSIIDDFSRKVWIYILKTKDEAFQKFKQWKKMVEVQTGKKVKHLRTDNGREFLKDEYKKFCLEEGLMRHTTVRYTPQQNGLAERMNKTLLERVRCMLSCANAPKKFWAEAVNTAAYLINKSPSTAIGFKTLEEMWSGAPPKYDHIRVFGCVAYAHIKQGKLDPRAIKCMFIGYPEGVKGYKLWFSDENGSKSIISRDVTFREDEMYMKKASSGQSTSEEGENARFKVELLVKSCPEIEEAAEIEEPDHVDYAPVQEEELESYQLTRDRPRRHTRPPERYGFADIMSYALTVAKELNEMEPINYKEAMTDKNSSKWIEAMQEEMESLLKNQTWILIDKPSNQKLVGCK